MERNILFFASLLAWYKYNFPLSLYPHSLSLSHTHTHTHTHTTHTHTHTHTNTYIGKVLNKIWLWEKEDYKKNQIDVFHYKVTID